MSLESHEFDLRRKLQVNLDQQKKLRTEERVIDRQICEVLDLIRAAAETKENPT